MEFTNSFTVAAPIDVVYRYLQQVEEVAPCVPGAQITGQTDDHHFQGSVKVKLGAVQMTFRGDLELTSDGASKTIVLSGKGRELRGGSGASGTVTAQLRDSDDGGTTVELLSRVDVSGRLAQFGRSIIPDVAGRLIHEFSTCLEAKLTHHGHSEAADVLDIGHATADAVKARGKEFVRGLAGRKDKSKN